jgi:hypothetical protein
MVRRVNVENPVADEPVVNTVSSGIWAEIKNKKIEMFSLPDQTVENYFAPVNVDPEKLYLTFKVSSALPALEATLGSAFKVELANKYIVVSKAR